MGLQGSNTKVWFDRARASLVNGVSSQFRYWSDDDTIVIERGEAGHLIDMDGNRYIDFQLGFGPVILGHADPAVTAAVTDAAAAGATSFAMTQRREIEASEKVLSALKWPDAMRFTNTGTEATMHSIRLARGMTGRDVVIKFEGQYHGVHDYVMFSTASSKVEDLGPREESTPAGTSQGIPDSIRTFIRTLPYNDLSLTEKVFRNEGDRIAAVIVEPILGNTFGIMPVRGFLQGLRTLCDEYGAYLIFDEVKTGFRTAVGGAHELMGVTPDIGTYAKAMGNGYPVAAIAMRGKASLGWKDGGIGQAGTYSGNGISTAAAGATIDRLTTGQPHQRIYAVGNALMDGLGAILAAKGVESSITGHPSMFSVFIGEGEIREFRDIARHNDALYEDICMRMIKKGVMPCPDARETWFVCAAHTDEDVAKSLQVFEESLAEALEAK